MQVFASGLDISENGQAIEELLIHEPSEHHLGTAHTLQNFETAFYRATTADNSSYEEWSEKGGLDSAQRANGAWKAQLAEYEAPEIDNAIDEELRAFVELRRAELPDIET